MKKWAEQIICEGLKRVCEGSKHPSPGVAVVTESRHGVVEGTQYYTGGTIIQRVCAIHFRPPPREAFTLQSE